MSVDSVNYYLRFLSGTRKGEFVELRPDTAIVFGRSSECDVCLTEGNASRKHARLVYEKGIVAIKDMDSRNGVFVNGNRVKDCMLNEWDTIVIGRSIMRLEKRNNKFIEEEDESAATGSRYIKTSELAAADAAVPQLRNHEEYRSLFECLLSLQNLLNSDQENLVEKSLDTLFSILPATRISILNVTPEGEIEQKYTTTINGPTEEYVGRSFARKVLEAGQAILMEDTSGLQVDDWGKTIMEQQVLSILGVPVYLNNKPVSVLLCDNREAPGALQERHRQLLVFVGRALTGVFQKQFIKEMQKKQLSTEREFLAAKRVQSQILNKKCSFSRKNMDWQLFFEPALDLGGDFFDYYEEEDSTIWVIADVCGKGVSAALVVSMLKAFCKVLYPQHLATDVFLRTLNDLIVGELPGGMFLTAFIVRVYEDGKVCYASVGHPRGLHLYHSADGLQVDYLNTSHGMVGMSLAKEFLIDLKEFSFKLQDKSRICIYTDGVIEAGPDEDQFGEHGVVRVMKNSSARSMLAFQDELVKQVKDVSGVKQYDDITILIGDYCKRSNPDG